MKRAFAVMVLLTALVPASTFAGNLTLRMGGFFPSADSNLFDDDADLYTLHGGFGETVPPGLKDSDWNSFTFGAAYFQKVANNVELGVSIDGYDKTLDTSYREFLNDDTGGEIFQTLHLTMVPMSIAVRLTPTSRRRGISPYLEVGGDAIYYKYEEFGDFIDFFAPPGADDIISDSFFSDGFGFGFHVAGGLKVPLSHDFSLVGEGRYQWAKTTMEEDFSQEHTGFRNEIDLSGWSATLGLNIRF